MKFFKNEIQQDKIHRHTHKCDVGARPELFKLIKISHEERLENAFKLLSDESKVAQLTSLIVLPNDTDALRALNNKTNLTKTKEPSMFLLNEFCLVLWPVGDSMKWYFGHITRVNDNSTACFDNILTSQNTIGTLWNVISHDHLL